MLELGHKKLYIENGLKQNVFLTMMYLSFTWQYRKSDSLNKAHLPRTNGENSILREDELKSLNINSLFCDFESYT